MSLRPAHRARPRAHLASHQRLRSLENAPHVLDTVFVWLRAGFAAFVPYIASVAGGPMTAIFRLSRLSNAPAALVDTAENVYAPFRMHPAPFPCPARRLYLQDLCHFRATFVCKMR